MIVNNLDYKTLAILDPANGLEPLRHVVPREFKATQQQRFSGALTSRVIHFLESPETQCTSFCLAIALWADEWADRGLHVASTSKEASYH